MSKASEIKEIKSLIKIYFNLNSIYLFTDEVKTFDLELGLARFLYDQMIVGKK